MVEVTIKPTEGCYQHDLHGVIVRETSNFIFVSVREKCDNIWKFSRKTMLLTGCEKAKFPRYKLVLPE